jgi:hypothetical protein
MQESQMPMLERRMKCQYCEQEATCKCASCPLKFCDFCVEEHLHGKGIPRRSWGSNKIMLEKKGETDAGGSILRWKRNDRD